ncbi:DUF6624 domain-containing protein [Streptomyces sp. H27-D2]|uniref:DUF6624 domain-containing protein n=1 Tax=Streptomyces sp. H27-D2 TaxID=3046304 RepID=UPI002DBB7E86|nr:DUF6624 domain-containing protein [Streptomyces sp. H27-D2]MEC4018188.1 DUF6624 domain-containing protein [Streptomyces sp. H27-D2]
MASPQPQPATPSSSDNTAALKRITAEWGWPGRTLVGAEAAEAAWLLVQHADGDPDFQAHALDLLDDAVYLGEAEPRHFAHLTDRTRIAQGQPQLYGTQYRNDEQGLRPHTVAATATASRHQTNPHGPDNAVRGLIGHAVAD